MESQSHSLVDGIIDNNVSDEQLRELNERLEGDAAFRRRYMGYMCIEAEMHAVHASGSPVTTPSAGKLHASANSVARSSVDHRPLGFLLVLAASFLAVAVGSAWLTYLTMHGARVAASSATTTDADSASQAGEVVAQVTGTRDCRWASSDHGTSFGAILREGQLLELEQGLAEVTFASGARVVIEGPATFAVPRGDEGELLAGRIAAVVPRNAVGFTIRTPRMAIADSGTQYGLVAARNGATEVHVFEGPIHARAFDIRGRETGSVQLSASQAARLTPVSADFAVFRAEGNRFTRILSPTAGPADGLLALEGFDYPAGPLAWQNGGFGWAGPWAELEVADGEDSRSGRTTNLVVEGSLAGCELISHANRGVQTGQHNRIRRALSTSIGGMFDTAELVEVQDGVRLVGQDDGTVYISLLQRASEINDVFYGFELHRGDGNANRVICVGSGVEQTGYGVSSNYNGTNHDGVLTPLFAALGEEDTDAHLFVLRIDFGDDNHDRVTVYRDPTSLINEERCTPTATIEGNFAFDRISLGNFNGTKGKTHEVDEIRVGTSFAAVTGQPTRPTNHLTNIEPRTPWRSMPGIGKISTPLLVTINPFFESTNIMWVAQ